MSKPTYKVGPNALGAVIAENMLGGQALKAPGMTLMGIPLEPETADWLVELGVIELVVSEAAKDDEPSLIDFLIDLLTPAPVSTIDIALSVIGTALEGRGEEISSAIAEALDNLFGS